MLFRENYSPLRLKKLYEREISRILYQLNREENFPSCSLSYSILSAKRESLKVYLILVGEEELKKTLELINQKYAFFIQGEIAKTKKFSRIPRLIFFLDKQLNNSIPN